jgi:hypothetical protein
VVEATGDSDCSTNVGEDHIDRMPRQGRVFERALEGVVIRMMLFIVRTACVAALRLCSSSS